MYHACRAFTLIPEDFRGPSFLFFVFFSLFRFSFRLLISVSSNGIRSMREEGKKLARGEFRCVPKDIVFWLVELDEITRNHSSPIPFQHCSYYANITGLYTWKNVTLMEEWCFDFVNANINQFGTIVLIHIN